MALVVTPGGALDDSLTTLAYFVAYCAAFGYDISSYSTEQQEVSIRKSTVWVEGLGARIQGRVAYLWPGTRATSTQRREWPRSAAFRNDGTGIDSLTIPLSVADATCEAAFFNLGNPGILDANVTMTEIVTMEKVGPLSVKYAEALRSSGARIMLSRVADLLSSILETEPDGPFLFFGNIGPSKSRV